MIIWIITSLWVLLGCAEGAHLITIMTDRSLQTYSTLCGLFVLAGLFVCVGIGFWRYRSGSFHGPLSKKLSFSPYMITFLFLAGITVYCFMTGYVPDLEDAVYEIVIGNVHSGSLMTEHPFRGGQSLETMPMRMQILGLSSLYSALITESQQSQYMIMCKVVPLCLWGFSMLLYQAYAEKLFPEDAQKRWVFLNAAALLVLVTMGSEHLVGYRLLHAGFSGETIRAVLLIPYTIYVCWQKKWILALLAVCTEAWLVWTTYGVGYCLFITVVMFAVHLLISRRKAHAA